MKIRKVISKPFSHTDEDVNVAGGINAAVSANVNEPGPSHTRVSSRQRIVQRNGRTEVFESTHSFGSGQDTESSKEGEDE